jgi:hypothetical protein
LNIRSIRFLQHICFRLALLRNDTKRIEGVRAWKSQPSIPQTSRGVRAQTYSRVLSVSNIIIIAALTGKNKHRERGLTLHAALFRNKKKIRFAVTQFRTRMHSARARLKNARNASRPGGRHTLARLLCHPHPCARERQG